MKIPVFFSYPKPFTKKQEEFVARIREYLAKRGFEARTLGVTDYDMEEPLVAIRRMMLESNGVLTIAFRRSFIEKGRSKPNSNLSQESTDLSNNWITSPWAHIEPAMAFQIGIPVLILREKGVVADGILEKGILGTYLPEFDLDSKESYLDSDEWNQIIGIWEGYVRKVRETKGKPPKLY